MIALAWTGAALGPLAMWWLWTRHMRAPRIIAGVMAVFWVLGVWAFLAEPKITIARHITVASPAWTGPPLRIAVLSDTHVGSPHVTPERVTQVVARLSRERPDVVVYLGDYAGGHEPAAVRAAPERSAVLRGVAVLGAAQAPLGRLGVLGNHDWWYDGPAIEQALRRAGVTVLENDAVRVDRPGGPFWIAGLADLDSRRAKPSAAAALAKVPPGEPVILLSHWPDPFPQVPARVAVTLAGHSHCGQVDFPILGRQVHASHGSARWACGLYDEGGRKLFVTGGLGTSILPVRFRAPPEFVIVTLRGRP
ncbi:MAG TPA: metallophosphoesterase [Phenylobacterium sp.]